MSLRNSCHENRPDTIHSLTGSVESATRLSLVGMKVPVMYLGGHVVGGKHMGVGKGKRARLTPTLWLACGIRSTGGYPSGCHNGSLVKGGIVVSKNGFGKVKRTLVINQKLLQEN